MVRSRGLRRLDPVVGKDRNRVLPVPLLEGFLLPLCHTSGLGGCPDVPRCGLGPPQPSRFELKGWSYRGPFPRARGCRHPEGEEGGGRTQSRGTVMRVGKWAFPGLWVGVGCVGVGGLPGYGTNQSTPH